jgi:hypothetical protein
MGVYQTDVDPWCILSVGIVPSLFRLLLVAVHRSFMETPAQTRQAIPITAVPPVRPATILSIQSGLVPEANSCIIVHTVMVTVTRIYQTSARLTRLETIKIAGVWGNECRSRSGM